MASRKLATLDGFYNSSGGMVQFAMRVKSSSFIPKIIDILDKNVLGFRLITKGDMIYSKSQHANIFAIPNNQSLIESAQYMYENHTLPFEQTLGSIGFNNDTIVLNMSHQIADGKYFTFVLDYLTNYLSADENNSNALHFETDVLPMNMESIFSDKIEKSNIKLPHLFVDKEITHIHQKTTINNNPNDSKRSCQYVSFNFPTNRLRCFNKSKNTCHGLTDSLWSSFILSALAFNGMMEKEELTGCTTCVDMRQFLDNSLINWSTCNMYSSVTVSATMNEKMLLHNFERLLRDDLKYKLNKGYQFAFLKTLTPPPPGMVVPGIGLELSNIGPFFVKSPITDVFMKSSVGDSNGDPLFSFSSFTVVDKKENYNEFYANMRYKSSIFHTKDAEAVGLGTKFALLNLDPNMTIKEALDAIKQFQKGI
ncbi:hypothetical protein TRFO_36845 [Tritrichomonas foetus]|uniref:Condensation domain-containing protein n=1 Tax=Tritrichomonas foetus TaxID=1144522 RepID=A0A1J4JHP6_9EUKA|nr:hypothetical protein TRFO_36845 [Tritrichomonas foetus]|eukprot:OHS97013.1 hypothetical protein TRFO_36845 [Tritrichomonas foetus]